jgi:hypothetical protein
VTQKRLNEPGANTARQESQGTHVDQHFKDLLEASSLGTPAARRIGSSTPAAVVDDVRRRRMERSPLQIPQRAIACPQLASTMLLSAANDRGARVAGEQPPAADRGGLANNSRRDPVVLVASSAHTVIDGQSRLAALAEPTAADVAEARTRYETLRTVLNQPPLQDRLMAGAEQQLTVLAVPPGAGKSMVLASCVAAACAPDQLPDRMPHHEADMPGRDSRIVVARYELATVRITIAYFILSAGIDFSLAKSGDAPGDPGAAGHRWTCWQIKRTFRCDDVFPADVRGVNYDQFLHRLRGDRRSAGGGVINLWYDSAAWSDCPQLPSPAAEWGSLLWLLWNQKDILQEERAARFLHDRTWFIAAGTHRFRRKATEMRNALYEIFRTSTAGHAPDLHDASGTSRQLFRQAGLPWMIRLGARRSRF